MDSVHFDDSVQTKLCKVDIFQKIYKCRKHFEMYYILKY